MDLYLYFSKKSAFFTKKTCLTVDMFVSRGYILYNPGEFLPLEQS